MPEVTSSKRTTGALRRGPEWKHDRRKELLDAADRTVARLGRAASMDDVAAEARVSRVVLYRYFRDKGGLYQALAERYLERLMAHLRAGLDSAADPRARLENTIDAYVGFIEEHRRTYDFLMHRAIRECAATHETVDDFIRAVAREVERVLEAEMTNAGADPAPAASWARALVGTVHLTTDWWLEGARSTRGSSTPRPRGRRRVR